MSTTLTFSRASLHELDRRAVEEYHIPILVLMENAGRAVAHAALRHVATAAAKRRVLILAGPGNNGGDGLVAARYLHNAGIALTILLLTPREHYKDAAATQLAIVEAMKLHIETLSPGHAELRDWLVEALPEDLLIDALFGTGLSRPPDGLAAEVIAAVNKSGHPILAVDIPSGLDCDTGLPAGAPAGDAAGSVAVKTVIRAAETVSFCGSKAGFPKARHFTGKVTIADIGAPVELLRSLAER